MSSGADPAPAPGNPDLEEQRVRIRRMIDESETFAAEQRTLFAEALKLECDRALAPWQIVFSSMAAGAAFFGAGAAFIKLLGA